MDKKEIEKFVEEELGDIISEYAEKITQNMIAERMENVRTSTLELGIDVKILPRPSGDCGLINKRDNNGLFPVDKFKIFVWESDDETVFHVDGYGWDVVFNFNSGELRGVVSAGNNVKVFEYIKNNIASWMNLTSNICKKITNVELIHLTWSSLN